MGYCGMNHLQDSDRASDMAARVEDGIVKSLNAHLKDGFDETNCYNTDPYEDIGLFFKDIITPAAKSSGAFLVNDEMQEIARKALKGLNKKIKNAQKNKKEWDSENLKDHLGYWRSMIKALNYYIENCW